MQRFFPLVIVFAAVLVLAACGRAPTDSTPQAYVISGTAVSPMPEYVPQGVVLLMADLDALAVTDVLELVPGIFSSAVAPVGADGSFDLVLPSADEMPAGVLTAATDFFRFGGATCTLDASVPTAQVSQYLAEGMALIFPGVAFLSLLSPSLSITTTEPFDFDTDDLTDHTVVGWLFATEDVTVSSEEAGCDVGGDAVHIDVHLTAGWNQVALSFERDPDTDDVVAAHLNNNSATQLYFNLLGGA